MVENFGKLISGGRGSIRDLRVMYMYAVYTYRV